MNQQPNSIRTPELPTRGRSTSRLIARIRESRIVRSLSERVVATLSPHVRKAVENAATEVAERRAAEILAGASASDLLEHLDLEDLFMREVGESAVEEYVDWDVVADAAGEEAREVVRRKLGRP